MARKSYDDELKKEILKSAAKVGAAKAAKENGVSYQTLLRWMKDSTADAVDSGKQAVKKAGKKVEEVSVGTLESINEQIAQTEEEINQLTAALNERKAALKELQKAKAKAEKILEKEEALKKEAAEKEQVLAALKNSDKSLDEILAFLK